MGVYTPGSLLSKLPSADSLLQTAEAHLLRAQFHLILRYLRETFIVTINMCRDSGTALITLLTTI